MVDRDFAPFVHPDDLASAVDGFQQAIAGNPEPGECRILTKSGEIRWLRLSRNLIMEEDRIVGLRGILTDITKQKRAEEAVRESEER